MAKKHSQLMPAGAPGTLNDVKDQPAQPKTRTARQLLNEFLGNSDEHADIKLLSVQTDGIPRQGELFDVTPATKQHIAVIKLVYRDPE